MHRSSTVLSSVIALVLVTLLPVQLVAHCDVPIPGLGGHAEDHHARSPDGPASGPDGSVHGSDAGGACTLQAPVFRSRPDTGSEPLALPPSETAVPTAAVDAPGAVRGVPLPAGSGRPPAPPLRI